MLKAIRSLAFKCNFSLLTGINHQIFLMYYIEILGDTLLVELSVTRTRPVV